MNSKIRLDILSPKLDSLARCLQRIESKKPFTQQELESNFDLQDIISINLERAVQKCLDIGTSILSRSPMPLPTDAAEVFSGLNRMGWISSHTETRMKKAVGYRNLAVHEYEKINWTVVFQIVTNHLVDFRQFAGEVLQKLSSIEND